MKYTKEQIAIILDTYIKNDEADIIELNLIKGKYLLLKWTEYDEEGRFLECQQINHPNGKTDTTIEVIG